LTAEDAGECSACLEYLSGGQPVVFMVFLFPGTRASLCRRFRILELENLGQQTKTCQCHPEAKPLSFLLQRLVDIKLAVVPNLPVLCCRKCQIRHWQTNTQRMALPSLERSGTKLSTGSIMDSRRLSRPWLLGKSMDRQRQVLHSRLAKSIDSIRQRACRVQCQIGSRLCCTC